MEHIITALVGMCGTGKSVAAKYIENHHYFQSIYFGGFVLEEVKRRGMEINSANEKTVREELRKQQGPDVMAKLAQERIHDYLSQGSNVIIDGLYSFSEYTYLKEKFASQLVIIAIHSAKKIRYQRMSVREVRPLTPRQVDERDFFEITNIEKAGPIVIADYHVVNNGSVGELEQQLKAILDELLSV
ncbi:MAG: AAA family ATPase [bacterium]|nr:AAA family ATPase [bacterium]